MIYKIQHTFKPIVIIPMLAVYPNHEWIFDKNKKMVISSDNVMATVIEERKLHFLSKEMGELVKDVYKTDVLTFGQKWFQGMMISTMEFIYLRLEKYEGRSEEDN